MPPRRPRDGEERKQRAEPGEGPGKDRAVYLDLLRRRWLGSAPPTAQAYARALNLWSQLPGALSLPLAEPGTSNAPPSQDDGGEPPPAAPAEDEERGS